MMEPPWILFAKELIRVLGGDQNLEILLYFLHFIFNLVDAPQLQIYPCFLYFSF